MVALEEVGPWGGHEVAVGASTKAMKELTSTIYIPVRDAVYDEEQGRCTRVYLRRTAIHEQCDMISGSNGRHLVYAIMDDP